MLPPRSIGEGAAGGATQFRLSALCRGPALFLQPTHGAALACGGAAALIATAGWPSTLLTVFAGDAGRPEAFDFAQLPGAEDAVLTMRRAEELCAAAVLGCQLRNLGLSPSGEPHDERDLRWRGRPGLVSSDLARSIAQRLMAMQDWQEGTQVFVPVAIGKSPGHRVVFDAGRTLAACGVRVWAYEDVPGGIVAPESTRAWLSQCAGALGAPLLLAIDTVLTRKLDAVACHASELSPAIPSVRDLRTVVADHARALGQAARSACERYWPVLG